MGTNLIKKVENTNNPSRGIGGFFMTQNLRH